MARYKRHRRYRKSTNTIMMKFQSFMDISTSDESMQVITVSAGGENILHRLAPQFGAYKYYKIGNISVKLVPASTLPVDPSGLSYEAGENQVNPIDQLTPGMMRITNGEDVFEDITGLSDDQQVGIYNNMLLDPRWFKWMLQSGVKRHATPRYWQVGQLHQDKWPGATINVPNISAISGNPVVGTSTRGLYATTAVNNANQTAMDNSSPYGFFQVGHKGVLGWLPTDGLQHLIRKTEDGGTVDYPLITSPVEVEVFKILLPKAISTRYYYRMFITETVYFRDPIVNFGIGASGGVAYRPLDVFHTVAEPYPRLPGYAQSLYPQDDKTGGNYGDD